MKIRNGFVSNSSSSSFIIAIDKTKNKPCECCLRVDPDFIKAIESMAFQDNENNVEYLGYSRLVDSIDNITNYEYFKPSYKDMLLEKLKPYSDENKWKVAKVSISYHNETLNDMMDNMVNAKKMVIVHKED